MLMLIEGVHFLPRDPQTGGGGAQSAGRKPERYRRHGWSTAILPGFALRPGVGERSVDLDKFFDGILELAAKTGNCSRRRGPVACWGNARLRRHCVCGAVPRGTALRRSGARPGHEIYVSGALGGSALGLETKKGKARQRHLCPEPRLALGRFLRETLRASSSIDLSDGLSLDLRRVCLASGVDAEIVAPPRFPGASLEQALHGGEDYELLFTVPARVRVPDRF